MIQSVYNYLMPEVMARPTSPSANNTHKKSELRSLYTHIINMNKRSPLYKVSLSDESQLFAISLKESTIALNTILSEMSNPEKSPFHQIKPLPVPSATYTASPSESFGSLLKLNF